MTTRALVDPELLPLLDSFPVIPFARETLPAMRAALEAQDAPWGIGLPVERPEPEVRLVPGPAGAPPIPVHIHRPRQPTSGAGAILHIHGGAMVLGSPKSAIGQLPSLVEELGAVGVSVDYRLAPETPFPGPQEDCYAALAWLWGAAGELRFDPARIVAMGESAGGGLTASLAHMARDRGEFALAGQVLLGPMLDHRTGGPDSLWHNPTAGEFVFNAHANQFGWNCLRGDYAAQDACKAWFSPALAEDLSGLAPAFMNVGGLDLLVDETLDYARRLSAAGVAAECHLYAGAPHGFAAIVESAVARRAHRELLSALTRMLIT